MAPWSFSPAVEFAVTLVIGFGFGFVLERAGFGNALNLAAQFYLHNMRVLKVMFTAIVTAMLLVFFSSALGWLDFDRVAVPPTYLGPAIIGGLLLGVGFIIGGYCPGTSLVAAATGKLDGMAFVAGVSVGLLAFAETVPRFWSFYHTAGYLDRMTLADLLGADAGSVVLGVVAMAVGAFAFAEMLERKFARSSSLDDPGPAPLKNPSERRWRWAAVGAAMGLAGMTWVVGQPSLERKIRWAEAGLEASLHSRAVHVDPAELLTLMHGNQMPLVLLDVRPESDFNVFHLLDARRVELDDFTPRWAAGVPSNAVVVVMSNDEAGAHEAWKRLAVLLNPRPEIPVTDRSRVYVLAGGVNRWLDLYQAERGDVPGPEIPSLGRDRLAHRFAAALGDRFDVSRPPLTVASARSFSAKVKAPMARRVVGGGCG